MYDGGPRPWRTLGPIAWRSIFAFTPEPPFGCRVDPIKAQPPYISIKNMCEMSIERVETFVRFIWYVAGHPGRA